VALEVRSPPWFDSLNVDYRLAYDDPLKQREYAGSRWAGTPAALLAQHLRQQLGMASASGSTAVACLLRVELQEFSQVFDSVQQSRGVLQAGVSLIDGQRQIVAERQVSLSRPVLGADAGGGVNALVAASDELGRLLAGWLSGLEGAGSLKGCRLAGAALPP
jgi:cholesterol transport system auxiliary component